MAIDLRNVERFLYLEARLTDEHRYSEWLSLWTDDAVYWVPCNGEDYDPEEFVSIVYEDRSRLQDRVDRLNSGSAWSQQPRSRMRRVISNVELDGNSGDMVTVLSNFVLVELRMGRQVTYAAQQIHKLRPVADHDFKMQFKKVILINNDEPLHNLTFLL